LTIIANAQPSLDWDLGDTHGTVAVRMPDDEYALSLLSRTGPLAVSSANISGRPAATTADEAQEMLGDDVDIYVDGERGNRGCPRPSSTSAATFRASRGVDPSRPSSCAKSSPSSSTWTAECAPTSSSSSSPPSWRI